MMSSKYCCVCHGEINGKNYRRTAHSSVTTYHHYLWEVTLFGDITKLSPFICLQCYNKIVKLDKIDEKLRCVCDQLRAERDRIKQQLTSHFVSQSKMPAPEPAPPYPIACLGPIKSEPSSGDGFQATPPTTTTSRSNDSNVIDVLPVMVTPKMEVERLQIHSPSPERIGKRPLISSSSTYRPILPKHMHVMSEEWACPGVVQLKTLKEAETQTQPLTSLAQEREYHVKILVQYDSQQKSRIVRTSHLQKLCKAIVNKRNEVTLAKIAYHSPLKQHFNDLVVRDLALQAKKICRRMEPSILRLSDFQNISWASLTQEWKVKAKLLYEVLEAITVSKRKTSQVSRSLPVIGFAGACLLFNRAPHMSRVQHVLGLLLDHSGATDETIKILNGLGISVSTAAVYKKKKHLAALSSASACSVEMVASNHEVCDTIARFPIETQASQNECNASCDT